MKSKELDNEVSSLHREALMISENIHKYEFQMIDVLQRLDQKKVYRFLGFKSLFQYAVIALKLSESQAYTFILVARKAANLDKFQGALRRGELNLSRAKRITSVITKENQDHWIKLAQIQSQGAPERSVAKVNPRAGVEEGSRFVSEGTLELKVAISLDTEKLVKRVQDVLSQSRGKVVSYDEVLKEMAQLYLDKKDPVRKAQRVLRKKLADPQSQKDNPRGLSLRSTLRSTLKHRVNLRDQGKCYCGDSRWIDIHHVVPVSQGGQNTLENLITLCRSHHQMEHY